MAQLTELSKPRYKVFFELIADTQKALKNIKIIVIEKRGVKPLYEHIKKNRIKLAHGSLRFDRDRSGTVFIQEFRPSPSIFQRGEFYSIASDKPFWEIAGTAIIRLAHRKERYKSEKSVNKRQQFCIILQGGLNINYIGSLLQKGIFSYNPNQKHLWEAPIFSALFILNRINRDQVLELKLRDKANPEKELNHFLFKLGKSVKNIACLVGKNTRGEYYTAPHYEETEFPVNVCNHKVVPIEISKEINRAHRMLLKGTGIIVLDELSFDELSACLKNRENYYYNIAHS